METELDERLARYQALLAERQDCSSAKGQQNSSSIAQTYLEHTVLPTEKHTHTVILLHGRDSMAREFAEEFFESQASDNRTLLESFPSLKWVFPASEMRWSARFNTELSQWFDMWSTQDPNVDEEIQREGMKESMILLMKIIVKEASDVSFDRVIIGGISQGCATAIYTLLSVGVKLGGFIGLCSWLPLQEDVEVKTIQSGPLNKALQTPVFLSHSKDDDVVPISNGENLHQRLKHMGMSAITWKAYDDGGHWVNEPQGVDDITEFIGKIVSEDN